MSKKSEKESAKQKENKSKNEKKETILEAPELKEPEKVSQVENKGPEVKKLQDEVAKLKKDKLLLLAEMENKRKEFQRQMEYVYKYSSKTLISRVLDFLVDLEERALKAMRNDLEDTQKSKSKNQELIELVNKFKSYLKGVKIIKDNLRRRLENEGVKEIEVKVGEDKGNSRLHELVEEVENDNLPEGTIVEVVEKGYFLHDQVLRPAKVKIAKRVKTN